MLKRDSSSLTVSRVSPSRAPREQRTVVSSAHARERQHGEAAPRRPSVPPLTHGTRPRARHRDCSAFGTQRRKGKLPVPELLPVRELPGGKGGEKEPRQVGGLLARPQTWFRRE